MKNADTTQVYVSHKRSKRRTGLYMLFFLTPVVLLMFLLIGTGILGQVGPEARDTNYRSAVGAQQPRRIALLEGVKIAYTDSGGTGPVLVCLHAIGHGARDFEDLTHRLSPQYRVIALDFPGQGNSGTDREPASATRYSKLLSEFVDQLGLKSVVLIGNSIGGAASIRYASAHPEHVRALVLCDTGGLGQPGLVGKFWIGAFVQFFAAGRRGAFWFPWAFSKYYQHVLIMESARIERDRISRSGYEIASPLEQAWRSFGTSEENLLPIVPHIQCPVLLAWAKQDFVLPLTHAEPYFRAFRNHQLEMFEGGHAAFLEDPDRFELALRSFLRSIAPPDHD